MTPKQLKQARLDAGLTQEQMALKLGLGTSTLRHWESLEVFSERMRKSAEARYNDAKSEIEACKTKRG